MPTKPADNIEPSAARDAQYRTLIEGVKDYAIYMLDPNGIVSSWNPGAERFKGYKATEIIGRHFSQFYTPEDREDGLPVRALETAKREGRFEKEGWRIRKDGTRFWAHVVIDAIWNRGEFVGFAKITRDLTERKESERQLEEARNALSQSQKMEAIGQLTGGVAHDFNNLLMGIYGSLDILRRRSPHDDRLSPFIENAIQSVQRGIALTKRLLVFARHQELEISDIDAAALLRGMAELMQRTLGPGVWVEIRLPGSISNVSADANQLEMAILNLAMNARDAMPNGGPIIIEAHEKKVPPAQADLAPGEYVCLAVTDTGEGMDEETLARAAEPFFTTKGIGKGTGLGLSVVHGMAKQLGGALVLRSKKGAGTTAEIWLRRSQGNIQSKAAKSAPPAELSSQALVVLAVDDEAIVLMSAAAMLEDMGFEVLQATSGERALEILQSGKKIDLVFTDYAMPRMTGAELTNVMSAKWPETAVVLTTGFADLPTAIGAKITRLDKPYSFEELAKAVTAATRGRRIG